MKALPSSITLMDRSPRRPVRSFTSTDSDRAPHATPTSSVSHAPSRTAVVDRRVMIRCAGSIGHSSNGATGLRRGTLW
jgi:hypothetical protein